ncbi:MAG: esterase-like activity of phytase family protein [Planctomycetota bacterium]
MRATFFATTLTMFGLCAHAEHFGPVEVLHRLELPKGDTGPLGWALNEVSAIEYLPEYGVLLALSDDRSENGPARVAVIEARFDPAGRPEFGELRWRALTSPAGGGFKTDTVDPEGLRLIAMRPATPSVDDRFVVLIASEGYGRGGLAPSLFEVPFDHTASTGYAAPANFAPARPGIGIDHNRGFESLAVWHTPDGWVAFTANEEPLRQDRPDPQTNAGPGVVRLVTYENGQPVLQQGYPLGPGLPGDKPGSHALAELLALDARTMLALENAKGADDAGRARLYWTTTQGATDLRDVRSTRDDGLDGHHLMPKVLIADFADLGIDARADDWEGMSFGPTLPSGERTLLVCEDNSGDGPNRLVVLKLGTMP